MHAMFSSWNFYWNQQMILTIISEWLKDGKIIFPLTIWLIMRMDITSWIIVLNCNLLNEPKSTCFGCYVPDCRLLNQIVDVLLPIYNWPLWIIIEWKVLRLSSNCFIEFFNFLYLKPLKFEFEKPIKFELNRLNFEFPKTVIIWIFLNR